MVINMVCYLIVVIVERVGRTWDREFRFICGSGGWGELGCESGVFRELE